MTVDILLALSTYPDSSEVDTLPAAVRLAGHIGANVTGLGIEVDFPDVSNPLAEAILQIRDRIKTAERKSHADAARLLAKLSELGSEAGIQIAQQTVRAAPAFLGDAVVNVARFHDLAAVPLSANDVAARGIAESLIFESGRPVILIPGSAGTGGSCETVVVATDFGRSASRALFDSHPFLRRASRVLVIVARDEKDLSRGNRSRLLAHFARHAIAAELVEIETNGSPIGEVLQDYAIKSGAGLLVMGAFGHSRLREFVLGGATATVLADPRLPVLMSH
jgi:nucleotide-binding universal stress UspA family protein